MQAPLGGDKNLLLPDVFQKEELRMNEDQKHPSVEASEH